MFYMFNINEKLEIYNEPLFGIQLGISNSLFSHTIINSKLVSSFIYLIPIFISEQNLM